MKMKHRDGRGRLRVGFFTDLIVKEYPSRAHYNANEFKDYVVGLDVLAGSDWDCESNGYTKWKHRVDRAAQRVFTGI